MTRKTDYEMMREAQLRETKLKIELRELREAHGAAVLAQSKAIERAEEAEQAVRVANSGTFMQRLTNARANVQVLSHALNQVREMIGTIDRSSSAFDRDIAEICDRALDWKPEP